MAHKPSGKPGLFVVVWEWANKKGRWRPYTPEVTQQLERAFCKKLTSVQLGDADPSLINFCVVFSTMKQVSNISGFFVNVRRTLYPQNSPAGQGAVWEWVGDMLGDWHTYDMLVQCALEDHWAGGAQVLDLSLIFQGCPYVISFKNMSQTNNKTGFTRAIRRKKQAAYPIGRPVTPQQQPFANQAGPSTCSLDCAPTSSDNVVSPRKALSMTPHKIEVLTTNFFSHKIFNPSGNHLVAYPVHKMPRLLPRPPKPLPRSIKSPPIPKPRTLFPSSSSQSSSTDLWPNGERSSSADGFKGSTMTLDSDVSLLSARRPSIETISTYLSQESFNSDSTRTTPVMNSGGPKMEDLIDIDSMSENEDEVFSVDQEVCRVMMGKHSLEEVPDSYSQRSTAEPTVYPDSQSHFVPITSPEEPRSVNDSAHKKRRFALVLPNGDVLISTPPYSMNSFKRRLPRTPSEKILVDYGCTNSVNYADKCTICLEELNETSSIDLNKESGYLIAPIMALIICSHSFHEDCIAGCVTPSPDGAFIICPNCKTIHGKKWGIQPEGHMTFDRVPFGLPGYEDCDTIRIMYMFKSGIQGPQHPKPGQPYHAVGFPRICYLPDSDKGNKALQLLVAAFKRRLTFTIGRSVTTGRENVITWNDIHHKTEWHSTSGYGYPDPEYLDKVIDELGAHGISEYSNPER